jgi:hypothetical protein
MNKKKLIRKMAIPAAAIFVISIIVLLFKRPVENNLYQKHVARLNEHIAALTQENQKYLAEIAKKIAAAGSGDLAASRAVADLQSEFLLENQKLNQARKYLWMSNQRGEFIFGVPAPVFAKLNDGFDKNREIIIADGHYKDRDDFLTRLIDKHEDIDFSDRKLPDQEGQRRSYASDEGKVDWRFYEEQKSELINLQHTIYSKYLRPRTFVLSAPVTSESGAVEGNLFLKVDDSINSQLYFSKYYATQSSIYDELLDPLFATFAVLSGLFLWFLLPSWVYIDAQQRAVSNPAVWAFITLIALIFGLAIYLITRPSTMKSLHCPKCENQLNGAGAFCPHCGFDLSSTYCPQCQYPVKPEWAFCPNCRAGLTQQKTLEAPTEQAKALESPQDYAARE